MLLGATGRNALRNGDPGGSRTPNPQIRSLMLYPVELRSHPRQLIRLELTIEETALILHSAKPRITLVTKIQPAL
jgi:hypothetical protein